MESTISANMEDYLETIHLLGEELGNVRVKDIADRMNVSPASVSGALKSLETQGLVSHPRYDLISLTEQGGEIARRVYERHQIILKFLKDILKLDQDTAEKDACRIEHNLSPKTFEYLRRFVSSESGIL